MYAQQIRSLTSFARGNEILTKFDSEGLEEFRGNVRRRREIGEKIRKFAMGELLVLRWDEKIPKVEEKLERYAARSRANFPYTADEHLFA